MDRDCFQWIGVVCHNVTGHVQELHLRSFYPEDDETEEQYEARLGGKINPSLLDFEKINN
jgi:hypothetical protein